MATPPEPEIAYDRHEVQNAQAFAAGGTMGRREEQGLLERQAFDNNVKKAAGSRA